MTDRAQLISYRRVASRRATGVHEMKTKVWLQ